MKKSQARYRLDASRDLILRLFDYRCIMCGVPTREVHEIVPISHGASSLAGRNRVPLCGHGSAENHHDWAHRVGTRVSIPILQEKRADFLRKKWARHGERAS